MRSLVSTLLGWLRPSPPRIRCARHIWRAGTEELAKRTLRGRRESGAYLLGRELRDGTKRILEFVYYDDIDPQALATGIVTIRQTALPRLWDLCRSRGYGVIADIHVHPGAYGQSQSDQANPVMPRAGHIAMILPNFARGRPMPGSMGLYEYLGAGRWADHTALGSCFLRLDNKR